MTKSKIPIRLEFLAELFNVFETDEDSVKELKDKFKDDESEAMFIKSKVTNINGEYDILAILVTNPDVITKRPLTKFYVSIDVFSSVIAADPTVNKIYSQWMLNIFVGFLKKGSMEVEEATRFILEDLPQTKDYLQVFEDNKRKKKFITLCNASYSLKGITDPSNINQYKRLSQLFDAIDPFIKKESSTQMETLLEGMVNRGFAEIPVRDRNFAVYIPLNLAASEVFSEFTSWCTAKKGNSMFNNYSNYKTPTGHNSKLYIIIPTEFFKGNAEAEDLVQIHFESDQIMNRKDSSVSIYENIISKSAGLSNFFYEELTKAAKEHAKTKGMNSNNYLKYLLKFGFHDSIFDIQDSNITSISFSKMKVKKMADMSRFKDCDSVIITDAEMEELHTSICSLQKIEVLSIPNNNLTSIPKEIGNMKSLTFLNLKDNNITQLPDEIKYLCASNGGSLIKLAVDKEKLGEANIKKLRNLLPNVMID